MVKKNFQLFGKLFPTAVLQKKPQVRSLITRIIPYKEGSEGLDIIYERIAYS